jgi:myosin heavy subunit
VQASEAGRKQKQAFDQERSKVEALGRELTSLRAELDTTGAVHLELERVQAAEAAKVAKERDKSETLARELASARKEAEEHSALLAAAHAEVLQVTETNRATAAEQKQALASERDRADALSRELTLVRNQLEAGNRQIAALNAQHALATRESAVDSPPERMAESSSRTIQAKQRLPEQQISGEAAASTPGPSGSESPPPGPQSTAREPSSDLVSKVAMATELSKSASAASRSVVDEQRLLARANTLLGRADISGARLLLEHALERGSARAAFMLAETYDARVLRSWHAHGMLGDLTKARELYERAQAAGIEDAKERLETLK